MTPKDRLPQADWQHGPRYGSPYTFMNVPATRDLKYADVAVLGLPFDTGTLHRPGARYGPRAIRDASSLLKPYSDRPDVVSPPFTQLRVVDYGDIDLDPNYIAEAMAQAQAAIGGILGAGVVPVCLGGDHSMSLATVRACAKKYGTVSLVLLDAHPEFWATPKDRPYNHGSWLRIAVEEGVVDPKKCVQVGIRGSNSMSILDRVTSQGITVIAADEVSRQGTSRVLETIRNIVQEPLCVSLDIDCVDPAFAPATGVPEVAGLTSREIVELVRGLKGLPAVSFDLMEVAPAYDHAQVTAILAATLVYEFLLSRC